MIHPISQWAGDDEGSRAAHNRTEREKGGVFILLSFHKFNFRCLLMMRPMQKGRVSQQPRARA